MFERTRKKRALALVMAVWMAAVCAAPALAAPIDSGVAPTYDEAYYATLDYYGNLVEGSVVKSYALNGASGLTDYGVYDQVVNLTDGTPVSLSEGSAAFQFDQAPDHFYFEGKTARPFQELPWTVALRYYLNGVPVQAEDLAGEKGVVEIQMDLIPNRSASSYARYNYTLEAMALFNEDDILSMEAPGAQVQLVGNLRTVLFMALPGEEEHFTIRVGSNDFSFNGMTLLMVPATLGQLEEIAKLSQRKDELEEDYRALSGSIDAMLDALNDIQGGLYDSANGLDRLNEARAAISSGKGTIYGDVDVLRGDLSNIAGLMGPVEQRVQALSQTVASTKSALAELSETTMTIKGQLDSLNDAITRLEDGTGDVKDFMNSAAGLEDSLTKLQKALNKAHISSSVTIDPVDIPKPGAEATVTKVKAVGAAYGEPDRKSFFKAMVKLNDSSLSDEAAAKTAASMEAALEGHQKLIEENTAAATKAMAAEAVKKQIQAEHPDLSEEAIAALVTEEMVQAAIDGMTEEQKAAIRTEVTKKVDAEYAKDPNWKTVQEMNGLYQAKGGMTFQQFCEKLPGVSKEQAKQMASLWTIYSGGAAAASLGLMPGALAGGALLPNGVLAAAAAAGAAPQADSAPDSGDAAAPDGDTSGDASGADSGTAATPGGGDTSAAPETPPTTVPTPPSDDRTANGAMVDLIAGSLDSMSGKLDKKINDAIDDINDQLDDLMDDLDSTLRSITRPSAAVVGELADLCAKIDSLTGLLDDATDVSGALKDLAPTVKDILDRADSLRKVLDGYEPTLQMALSNAGRISTAAAYSLRDLERLLADTESLAQTSGVQLDEGTQQTLRGLSQSLRKTGRALSTTADVKDAKNALTDIIEDTWNEYTGDVNNLLMMDAGAQPVSLTDARNPAPSSVQILLRTQEIKQPEPELAATTLAVTTSQGDIGFFGRIVQMLRDFWAAITGIFH